MARYLDQVLEAAGAGRLPATPARPIAVVGTTRPGALGRILDGWGLPEGSVAWIGTPGGGVGDLGRAALAHTVAHAIAVYGCSEVWCVVDDDDPAFQDPDAGRRARLGLASPARGAVRQVVNALVAHSAVPVGVPVVGLVVSAVDVRLVVEGTTGEARARDVPQIAPERPAPVADAPPRPRRAHTTPPPPPMPEASSAIRVTPMPASSGIGAPPQRSLGPGRMAPAVMGAISGPIGAFGAGLPSSQMTGSQGDSGSVWTSSGPLGNQSSGGSLDSFGPMVQPWGPAGRDLWSGDGGSSSGPGGGAEFDLAGGGDWGASGGAAWGDQPSAPVAVVTPAPPPKSARSSGTSDDLSGIAPAIVDAARTLRRFLEDDVPSGVVLRVMKSRIKTDGTVRAGLGDLRTLIKEHGTGKPGLIDAYRMVDHALPRVREKQGMKVLRAIFGVE